MALPLSHRLKKKKDFENVFKKGRAVNGVFLFIKYVPSATPRFGFVISAKVAPKAVLRNKIRRVLSAAIHPNLLPDMPACDTVVVVTKRVPADPLVIRDDFLAVLRKARFIR